MQIEPAQTETGGGGRGNTMRAPPPLPPGGVAAGCWFCLSNPEADPSLVASICTDFYMCIDKVREPTPTLCSSEWLVLVQMVQDCTTRQPK